MALSVPEPRIAAPARRVPPRAGLGAPRARTVPSAERHPVSPQQLLAGELGEEGRLREGSPTPSGQGSLPLSSQPSLCTTWVFVHLQVSRGFSSVDGRVLGCGASVSCGRKSRASALRLVLCEFAPSLTLASGKRCRVWTSPE